MSVVPVALPILLAFGGAESFSLSVCEDQHLAFCLPYFFAAVVTFCHCLSLHLCFFDVYYVVFTDRASDVPYEDLSLFWALDNSASDLSDASVSLFSDDFDYFCCYHDFSPCEEVFTPLLLSREVQLLFQRLLLRRLPRCLSV
jgi:hypothetical protein